MNMSRKFLALTLSSAMALSIAACGGGGSTTSTPANSTPATSTPPASSVSADIGEHSFMLGTDAQQETVTHFYATTLADELAALSGGKMEIVVYSDGTLGGDVSLLESCNDGSVQMVIQTTAPQVNFVPELALFDLPMAYPSIDDYRKLFDDEAFMSQISDFYTNAGYKLLGYADQTFRVMSSNVKVESMADFNGIKIRTMENPNHMDFWSNMGASPTPMAWGETYTGLQQGTVAAQENPYAVIAANKIYEVQDYIIQTNHIPHILSLIMNPAAYEALNDAERAILDEAVANATAAARQEADVFESEKIAEIAASGTEIVPVSEELYNDMKAAAEPTYQLIAGKVGQDLVDAYLGR